MLCLFLFFSLNLLGERPEMHGSYGKRGYFGMCCHMVEFDARVLQYCIKCEILSVCADKTVGMMENLN